MLALPPGCSPDDLQRLADWLEASALVASTAVSKSEVMEELQSGGLALPREESFGEDADELSLDDEEETEDALERLADDIFAECRQRAIRLQDGYPFALTPDLLSIKQDSAYDSYALLLVADLGHHFTELKDALVPDTHTGVLMEKVVEAAARGIFGTSQRFGWPREPDWPSPIELRVARLAAELDVVVDSLDKKTDPADKDRTLDVVGMLELESSYEATLIVLIQCAAGGNWKGKLGDPSITAWHNLLLWRSPIVRAVALPWRLGGRRSDWDYGRIYSLSNGAMVLDRPRLLAGRPDLHLDPAIRPAVEEWWKTAISMLPHARVR